MFISANCDKQNTIGKILLQLTHFLLLQVQYHSHFLQSSLDPQRSFQVRICHGNPASQFFDFRIHFLAQLRMIILIQS